jgi:hypothetical protein
MTWKLFRRLVAAPIVLLLAWYVGEGTVEVGLAVAIVGLAVTFKRGALGLLAAGVTAAALSVSAAVLVYAIVTVVARSRGGAIPRVVRSVSN